VTPALTGSGQRGREHGAASGAETAGARGGRGPGGKDRGLVGVGAGTNASAARAGEITGGDPVSRLTNQRPRRRRRRLLAGGSAFGSGGCGWGKVSGAVVEPTACGGRGVPSFSTACSSQRAARGRRPPPHPSRPRLVVATSMIPPGARPSTRPRPRAAPTSLSVSTCPRLVAAGVARRRGIFFFLPWPAARPRSSGFATGIALRCGFYHCCCG